MPSKNPETVAQESPNAVANKILKDRHEVEKYLKDRQSQQFACDEPKCSKVFRSHAEMYYHWITHKMENNSKVQIKEKQEKTKIVAVESDKENETDSSIQKENQPNEKIQMLKAEESLTPRKYKLGKLKCSECKIQFTSFQQRKEHRRNVHGTFNITPEPTELPQLNSESLSIPSDEDTVETTTLYCCNECNPPKLMNYEGVVRHQTIEEPEHVAENMTVLKTLLNDDKILTQSVTRCLDLAYIDKLDGVYPQAVIKDQLGEANSSKTVKCKLPECGFVFDSQIDMIDHIVEKHASLT